MFKYYISIVLLGIFVVVLIVEGIIIAGSPISQKDIQLDNNRLQAFDNIKYQIENYYRANHKMPNSLSDLSSSIDIKDPETKTNFDYKLIPPYSYQLCATFSTDNSKTAANYNNYGSDSALYKNHKKGYDCVIFKLSDYVINSYNAPSPPPTNLYSITLNPATTSCSGTSSLVHLTWMTQRFTADWFDISIDGTYTTNNGQGGGTVWDSGPLTYNQLYRFKVQNHDWDVTGGIPVQSNEVLATSRNCTASIPTSIPVSVK